VLGEKRRGGSGTKRRPAIGEEALRRAVVLDGDAEDASDLRARGPAQALKGDDAAAVVVDHAQDPDGDEAEDED